LFVVGASIALQRLFVLYVRYVDEH